MQDRGQHVKLWKTDRHANLMDSLSHQPLGGDPRRRANATIAGFDYQLWKTLQSWVYLPEDSLLYVEGAEDYDVIEKEAAYVTQVKAGVTPFSLGSQAVTKAINDYWKLTTQNPGRKIHYVFVSQAGIACEQARVHQSNEPLIKVWNRGARAADEISEIVKQLRSNSDCDASLLAFLSEGSPQEIREQLIHRITWQMSDQNAEGCKRLVEDAVVAMGEKTSVDPTDARRSVATLYQQVMLAARDKRAAPLSRVALLDAFESATKVLVTKSDFIFLQRARKEVQHAQSQSAPKGDFIDSSREWRTGPPPMTAGRAKRDHVVTAFIEKAARSPIFAIHGSTGMGKTTLANMMVRKDGGSWLWWSARGLSADETRTALRRLRLALAYSPSQAGVVLDDIDFSPASLKRFEVEFVDVAHEAIRLRTLVVVTSQKPPPKTLSVQFEDSCQAVDCPRFSEDDLIEMADALGCPDLAMMRSLAAILIGSCSGHPQLIHARLSALKQDSWIGLTAQSLVALSVSPSEPAQEAAALISELPEPQRQMLWRLSMIHCPFKREHALRLAELPPPTSEPGIQFDALSGPWIESLHDGYFRVSPLIEQGGGQVLAPSDVRRLHNAISTVLWQRNLTDFEAVAAFRHAWLAQNGHGLVTICAGLSFQKPKNLKMLAWRMGWFLFEQLRPGEVLFAQNRLASVVLRVLQFRAAGEVVPSAAKIIFERLEEELHGLPKDLEIGPLREAIGALPWLCESVTVSPATMLRCLSLLIQCQGETRPEVGGGSDLKSLTSSQTLDQLAAMTMAWCTNIDQLSEWVAAVDEADLPARNKWIDSMTAQPHALHGMVERAWLHESDKDSPDWPRTIEVLKQLDRLGEKYGSIAIRVASASSQAMVYFDNMQFPEKAAAALSMPHLQNHLNPFVLDRIGRLEAAQGRHEHAIAVIEQALAAIGEDPFTASRKAFMAVQAAYSAGQLGRLAEARNYLETAAELFKNSRLWDTLIGTHADLGFVCYEMRDYAAAVNQWCACLTLIQRRLSKASGLQEFATRKAAGHIIAWVFGEVCSSVGSGLFKPSIAFATSVNPKVEITSLPESDWNGLWVQLIAIGIELGHPLESADTLMPKLLEHHIPAFKAIAWNTAINGILESGESGQLPEKLYRWMLSLAEINTGLVQSLPMSSFDGSHDGLGFAPYLVAVLQAIAKGRSVEALIEEWRINAGKTPWSEQIGAWFDEVKPLIKAEPKKIHSRLERDPLSWDIRAIIAARCCASFDLSPREQAIAQYQLTIAFAGNSIWRRRARMGVISLTSRVARKLINTPFLVANPRITIPQLEAALNNPMKGFRKAGEIVLATADACGLVNSTQIVEQLRGLAD
jgi:tetratricopeptide (TPR) repeat protein